MVVGVGWGWGLVGVGGGSVGVGGGSVGVGREGEGGRVREAGDVVGLGKQVVDFPRKGSAFTEETPPSKEYCVTAIPFSIWFSYGGFWSRMLWWLRAGVTPMSPLQVQIPKPIQTTN